MSATIARHSWGDGLSFNFRPNATSHLQPSAHRQNPWPAWSISKMKSFEMHYLAQRSVPGMGTIGKFSSSATAGPPATGCRVLSEKQTEFSRACHGAALLPTSSPWSGKKAEDRFRKRSPCPLYCHQPPWSWALMLGMWMRCCSISPPVRYLRFFNASAGPTAGGNSINFWGITAGESAGAQVIRFLALLELGRRETLKPIPQNPAQCVEPTSHLLPLRKKANFSQRHEGSVSGP